MDEPNAVWAADLKGEFRTLDGRWCYPLTITDGFSRYVLCCRGMPQFTREWVQPGFDRAFRDYGLPLTLRSDNGPPFVSRGLAISKLTA